MHAKAAIVRKIFAVAFCFLMVSFTNLNFVEFEVMNLQDEEFMQEALRLARNAAGRTSPNPLVGAVIVREGRIVGAGWHRKAGTPHAEIHALNMAGNLAKGATLYVTLEPCSHYGRTGPCAEAVVKAGIKRVVIGMGDPNPKVAGKGIAILERAGIEVRCGVLEDEARALNEVFLKWIATQKPFVVLKTAMSLDGKIATHTGKSQWITGEAARRRVHEYRDTYDGIQIFRPSVSIVNSPFRSIVKNIIYFVILESDFTFASNT